MNNLGPAQIAAHMTVIDGHLLLVRTYADGTLTAAVRSADGWGREYDLALEAVSS